MQIYVDADACPVKTEVVRVAARHSLIVYTVSNSWMRLDESPLIKRVVVIEGPDAADDWIAERVGASDIAVTADILLAARCLKAAAQCIGPTGKAVQRGKHRYGACDAGNSKALARNWGKPWVQPGVRAARPFSVQKAAP